jgi:ribonuclease D
VILPTGLFQEGKKNSIAEMNKTYPENITVDEIRSCELSWYRGEIIIVDDFQTFNSVMSTLWKKKVLGFDTETRPSFKRGVKYKVSLLQLASNDFACLFRINKIGIPEELARLLSDPSIIKTGVAVNDDIKFLKSIRKFTPAGFIDLQSYVKHFGIQSSGLKKLTAIILGFRISKGQQITDWEAEELTEAQRIYAATDAWVCHEIFNKLNS